MKKNLRLFPLLVVHLALQKFDVNTKTVGLFGDLSILIFKLFRLTDDVFDALLRRLVSLHFLDISSENRAQALGSKCAAEEK